MQPSIYDVHVNVPLTNVSIAYMQDQTRFVAPRVFPNVPVLKASDVYYSFTRADFNRDEMQVRQAGRQSAGSGFNVTSNGTYRAEVYALHHDIPDMLRANTDSVLNQDLATTQLVTLKALIKRENFFVNKYFASGVWGNQVAGVGASPSSNQILKWSVAGSTPIENVRQAITLVQGTTGFRPNKLLINQTVADVLLDHAEIIDRVKYGQTWTPGGGMAEASLDALAALWGLDEVLVAGAVQNTAAEGATEATSFIAGNNALLVYAPAAPALMTPSAGYTFSWTGYYGAGVDGSRIKRFRMEPESSDRIEIEMAWDMQVVGADLGYFFNAVI